MAQESVGLPPEILKKVRLIELATRKLVNNLFAGEYHTAFKGQGMQFAEFREYVPGDDVRSISWSVTAKQGKPFIKKYEEERELTTMLAVDVSASGDFGTENYFKGEVLTYLAAILGFSANRNNDQVGLVMFSDQVEHFVPPKKGRGQTNRILRDLLYFKPSSRGTDVTVICEHLTGVLKKRATVFIMSDFMGPPFGNRLRSLARKHDVVALVVEDSAELELPQIGVVDIQDAETGEILTVDTSNSRFRKQYEEMTRKRRELRDSELRKAQIEVVRIPTNEDFVNPLVQFFQGRHR